MLLKNQIRQIKLKTQFKEFTSNNKNTKIYLYQIILVILFLVLAIMFSTINFFYDGHNWLSLKEVQTSLSNISSLTFIYPIGSIMCGFCMPMVGLCMQVTTRNLLAEPTTLGFFPLITTGLMVSQQVSRITQFPSYYLNYVFAFIFSIFVVLINFLIVKGKGNKQGFKAILIGFAISALFTGVNYLIFEYSKGVTIEPLGWFFQNISSNKESFIISGILMLLSCFVMFFLSTRLKIIQKDWIIAKTLGIKVDLIYWTIAFCAILVTLSSMLLLGGIVLLGLVVPHIVRLISRSTNFNYLLPMSGIIGISLLSASSMLYKATLLNINLLIAIIAIPVLFGILLSRKRVSS